MTEILNLTLCDIEQKVCDIASEQLNLPRNTVSPKSRLIEDLHCDSLELIALVVELENQFDVTIPTSGQYPIFQAMFTRKGFCLSDLAECISLQQGTGKPTRSHWRGHQAIPEVTVEAPFCQLGGKWDSERDLPLFERIGNQKSFPQYRRRSDGMRCIMVPAAKAEIGTDSSLFGSDCCPQHSVHLDSFLMDAEPVSTTAYCRFLNSIGVVEQNCLNDWVLLTDDDDRIEHILIETADAGWQPICGCEKLPMILVSWYGANAYSHWANRKNWRNYRSSTTSYLPTEAQWEYAARGPKFQLYPWGDEPPTIHMMAYGQHASSETYSATTLPMTDVNHEKGLSPFGLNHMAGNVWQWCRDWYDDHYYSLPAASEPNAFNQSETGVRSERGGSWVGPEDLCRSSHRRGRVPNSRGRCLGFRCVSETSEVR